MYTVFTFIIIEIIVQKYKFVQQNNTKFKIEYIYSVRTEIISDRDWLFFSFSLFAFSCRRIFFFSFHYTCITCVHVVIQEKISFSLGKLALLRDIKVEGTYSDHEHATPSDVGLVDEDG